MMPSAPAATAARAIGDTRCHLPVPWLGSTTTGRCESRLIRGTAERSRVLRGEQQLLHGTAGSTLQEYRLSTRSDLGQQLEVLHIPRADLDEVGISIDRIGITAVHQFGRNRSE